MGTGTIYQNQTIAAALDGQSEAEAWRSFAQLALEAGDEATLRRRRSAVNRCFFGWWAAVRSAIRRLE